MGVWLQSQRYIMLTAPHRRLPATPTISQICSALFSLLNPDSSSQLANGRNYSHSKAVPGVIKGAGYSLKFWKQSWVDIESVDKTLNIDVESFDFLGLVDHFINTVTYLKILISNLETCSWQVQESETISKTEFQMLKTTPSGHLQELASIQSFWSLNFVSFGFVSNFGLRISSLWWNKSPMFNTVIRNRIYKTVYLVCQAL